MAPLSGIDVSGIGQGPRFDWAAYRGKIAFAFIKATEGLTFVDPDFERNWGAAKSEGIIRGAYHYLHPDDSGPQQADFFLRHANPQPGDLVMVDVETYLNSAKRAMTPQQVAACAVGFADIVRAKTGAWPVVYTDQSMAEGGFLSTVGQCPSFIANPSHVKLPSPIGPWHLVSFVQTGQRGVDTDEFYGTVEQLRRLAVAHPVPTEPPAPHPAPAPAPAPAPHPDVLVGFDVSHGYQSGARLVPLWLTSTDGGKTYHVAA